MNFYLISDPDFEIIEAYGARRLKRFMGKSFLGIVRSTCLIAPDGTLAYQWPTAPSKGHAAQVLAVLEQLRSPQAAARP